MVMHVYVKQQNYKVKYLNYCCRDNHFGDAYLLCTYVGVQKSA